MKGFNVTTNQVFVKTWNCPLHAHPTLGQHLRTYVGITPHAFWGKVVCKSACLSDVVTMSEQTLYVRDYMCTYSNIISKLLPALLINQNTVIPSIRRNPKTIDLRRYVPRLRNPNISIKICIQVLWNVHYGATGNTFCPMNCYGFCCQDVLLVPFSSWLCGFPANAMFDNNELGTVVPITRSKNLLLFFSSQLSPGTLSQRLLITCPLTLKSIGLRSYAHSLRAW